MYNAFYHLFVTDSFKVHNYTKKIMNYHDLSNAMQFFINEAEFEVPEAKNVDCNQPLLQF